MRIVTDGIEVRRPNGGYVHRAFYEWSTTEWETGPWEPERVTNRLVVSVSYLIKTIEHDLKLLIDHCDAGEDSVESAPYLGVTLDHRRFVVSRDDKEGSLGDSAKAWKLLAFLVQSGEKGCSMEDLRRVVWEGHATQKTIEDKIGFVRSAVEKVGLRVERRNNMCTLRPA